MKRAAPKDANRASKRLKSTKGSSSTFRTRRTASELQTRKPSDGDYIVAKISMIFARLNLYRLYVCNGDDDEFTKNIAKVDLQVEGSWTNRLQLIMGDELLIALKGTQIIKSNKTKASGMLPIILTYSDGIAVKILNRKGAPQDRDKIIEYWTAKKPVQQVSVTALTKRNQNADDFDWYATPADLPALPPTVLGNESDSTAVDRVAGSSSRDSNRSPTVTRSSPVVGSFKNSDSIQPPSVAGMRRTEQGEESTKDIVMASAEYSPLPEAHISAPRVAKIEPLALDTGTHSAERPSSSMNLDLPQLGLPQMKTSESMDTTPTNPGDAFSPGENKPAAVSLPSISDSHPTAVGSGSSVGQGQNVGGDQDIRTMKGRSKRERKRCLREFKQQGKRSVAAPAPASSVLPPVSSEAHLAPSVTVAESSVSPVAPAEPPSATSTTTPSDVSPEPMQAVVVDIGQVRRQIALAGGPLQDHPRSGPSCASTSSNAPINSEARSSAVQDPAQDSALAIKVGLQTVDGYYTPLAELQAGKTVSVIAVVTSAREIGQTRTGDFSQCLTVLDPSNLDSHGDNLSMLTEGIKMNCFTKKYKEWLPMPIEGDVIIFRKLKISEFNGKITATGYADTFRWALYDAVKGQPKEVDASNGDDGRGYNIAPFWTPLASELVYCAQLTSWWKAIQKKRKETMGVQVNIGEEALQSARPSGRRMREHRLICDANPGAPPDGFFDCTVEVFYSHPNDNGPSSLYVTDYTSNANTHRVQANWCPPNLSDKIFKIEMWNNGATLAQTMNPGELWFMGNVRMRLSSGGLLEGSFSESHKAHRLEEDQAESTPTLRMLLERKKQWKETNTSPHDFPHKLISEVKELDIFDCTVELLHTDLSHFSTIYVTDYTERRDLKPPPAANWSKHRDGLIVTINMRESQKDMASRMKAGKYYQIAHLRLGSNGIDSELYGKLGGHDRLVSQLNSQGSNNEELKALLARKQKWETKPTDTAVVAKSSGSSRRGRISSIKEIVDSNKCPERFRLRARVVDFGPLNLRDCVIWHCEKCHKRIPENRQACVDCNDTLKQYAKCLFKLFFKLKDEYGDHLVVAVDEDWSVLAGLSPVDFNENEQAFEDLTERLRPYIGNLVEKHEAFDKNEDLPVVTEECYFTVNNWRIPGEEEERAYGLA